MVYRKIGRSGIEVSGVALGCMSLCANPTYAEIPEAQAVATVHAALDAGINFFDNAPAYGDGEAERRLGKALVGRRDKAVVATKILTNELSAEDVRRELDASLKRLSMEYVDLYQVHWPKRVRPIEETLRAMEDARRAGKVRAIGVCNFGAGDLREMLQAGVRVETDQLACSLLLRGPEIEVEGICREQGMGILCYSPLAQGLLAGKYASADEVPVERARTRHFAGTRPQARHGEKGCEEETFRAIAKVKAIAGRVGVGMEDLAIAWLLSRGVVTSVLAGASRPDQVVRNARGADVKLSQEVVGELEEATRGVKEVLGSNLDPWQGSGQSRIR